MLELKLASTGCYILSVLLLWHFCLLIPKMCVPVRPHTDLVLPVLPVISAEELSLVFSWHTRQAILWGSPKVMLNLLSSSQCGSVRCVPVGVVWVSWQGNVRYRVSALVHLWSGHLNAFQWVVSNDVIQLAYFKLANLVWRLLLVLWKPWHLLY